MTRATYNLRVTFRDGTGHTYRGLTRAKVATLTARQFAPDLLRPESVEITTQRGPVLTHSTGDGRKFATAEQLFAQSGVVVCVEKLGGGAQ